MKDDDFKNIIQFPANKIVRRVGKDQQSQKIQNKLNDQLKKQQTKQYIESAVDDIVMKLINSFLDMAIKTDKITFTKDLAMVVDTLRGLIYRDFGMKHTSHSLTDKLVDIKQLKNGHRSAKIDYSRVVEAKPATPTKPFSKDIKEEVDDLSNGANQFFTDETDNDKDKD